MPRAWAFHARDMSNLQESSSSGENRLSISLEHLRSLLTQIEGTQRPFSEISIPCPPYWVEGGLGAAPQESQRQSLTTGHQQHLFDAGKSGDYHVKQERS